MSNSVTYQTKLRFHFGTDAKGLRRGKLRNVRGKNIDGIDQCLQAYDGVRHGYNLGLKSQALSALLAACAHWLKLKKVKGGPSVGSRRAVILQLANDVFTE